ncbi:phosphate acyltransferase [Pararhizobium haloflavum]|uniref:phosphate acyltransferase n=1 Tax=Pararhizobium haloflavum TaxID=2037914 RepID=UPI000C175905|nr:phosphate acyltransferase [Pararhizobium haloflavum]
MILEQPTTEADRSPFLAREKPVCNESLLRRARGLGRFRVAIAQAAAPLPLIATRQAMEADLVEPVLVGDRDAILAAAAEVDWDVSGIEIINGEGEEGAAVAAFAAARAGHVDAVMKGHLHSDVLMRVAIDRDRGIRGGQRFVHVFHLTVPGSDKPLLISDAAVNVVPDMATRQQSIRVVADMLAKLGIARPRIAILSATETPMASMASSIEARQLADWAVEAVPQADVRGPYALDLILSSDAVKVKELKDDPVAGRADGIIVPDIVSGNALFKALVYVRGACAAGVVIGGKVPVMLTSRADPPEARLASFALAAIAARAQTAQ